MMDKEGKIREWLGWMLARLICKIRGHRAAMEERNTTALSELESDSTSE